ncbi:hypothetical protein [Pacificimonas flava]|uniref:Uncharacterized protein n=1 Tax=Pacificimonas flava TaxID=1234595 RepID=M2TQD7_9SPHN|nr:hypothetical protein [Pacificimonas flava]EMD83976.1 hypothetical protein C725_0948 [Pacificimonas flava]MBB5281051.1 putative Zn-dependent peptidase [Pacificimonas flava]
MTDQTIHSGERPAAAPLPPHMRPRAVFSQADFPLLRKAVQAYLQTHRDEPDTVQMASLYHRLGRVD